MSILREDFEGDLERATRPTAYETELNRCELHCGVCGGVLYVDRETMQKHERALEHDIDNQFICYDCERDYEDLEQT